VGRHRHAINVRTDGLATVLGPLSADPAVRAALLVDVDSGMVLDLCGDQVGIDPEELGAAHGDLIRLALGAATGATPDGDPDAGCEVLISRGDERHLVVRRVPDPHGDRLVLSVLLDGPPRALRRVRRRLNEVSESALTAGPTVSLRPVQGAWVPASGDDSVPAAEPVTRSIASLLRGEQPAGVRRTVPWPPPVRPAGPGPATGLAGGPAGNGDAPGHDGVAPGVDGAGDGVVPGVDGAGTNRAGHDGAGGAALLVNGVAVPRTAPEPNRPEHPVPRTAPEPNPPEAPVRRAAPEPNRSGDPARSAAPRSAEPPAPPAALPPSAPAGA
jgi:hypothetical protein